MPTARQLIVGTRPTFKSSNTLIDASSMLGELAIDAKEPAEMLPRSLDLAGARALPIENNFGQAVQKTVELGNEASSLTKPESSGASTTRKPELWLSNIFFVTLLHLAAIYVMATYPFRWETALIMFAEYQIGMFGITMGYHRLWSHKAFSAALPLRVALALAGTLGFQGSVKWWVVRHRMHHRYTDTEHDPYNAKRGFWFSHIGWIFEQPRYQRLKLVDYKDLDSDIVLRLQHRFFAPLALALCFGGPAVASRLWYGDALSGFLYGGIVLRVILWHAVFCINSWAHIIGKRPYSLGVTAKGNLGLSLLTNGEGWHNFHHTFPHDYRNGVDWFHWDPTKWLILACHYVGLAWDLEKTEYNEVVKARVLTAEKQIKSVRRQLNWGPKKEDLVSMTWSHFLLETNRDPEKRWVVIDSIVADVAKFAPTHPGGAKVLDSYVGKDASAAFRDGLLNRHSDAAKMLVDMMAIARIVPDSA